jgi:hypothetical protein
VVLCGAVWSCVVLCGAVWRCVVLCGRRGAIRNTAYRNTLQHQSTQPSTA